MNSIRHILIGLVLLFSINVRAQFSDPNWGKLPTIEMRSTSSMVGSGTSLPLAAVSGTTTTATYSPANASRGQRRALDDDDIEEGGSTHKPGQPFPIGDAVLPLLLMAMGYMFLRYRKKRFQ